jgi:hypothetical protein
VTIIGRSKGKNPGMETPTPRTSRRGRPPKGNRVGTFVSLPVELREACLEMGQREGLPLTDVVTRLVAEALDRPAPAYCYPHRNEELPLDRAS